MSDDQQQPTWTGVGIPAKYLPKRLRRRAARFLLRKVLRWGLVAFGWVLGAALCAATVLIGFLAGWVLP